MNDNEQPAIPTTETGFVRSRIRSFGHAVRGWRYVMRTQRNAWIHALISVGIFVVAFWLGIGPRDWAIIIVTTAMVFATEFMNTAIEVAVDLASPQMHPLAKIAKDVAAGSVLLTALAAVVIGVLVLGPPLWSKLAPYTVHP
jgi:diacylglycerol kinase